ncbi:MAG: hypothetical protein EZS28_028825 [Streblomastix strix]|uniref:Uncharacterized protein n=1 Tax=Streblomastix strix TaxID=222440 RepID=A0A5J4UY48_9EUKA|nr:MAG: hypothetical protein EZS28_028825 [Streblomastix strix]
MIPPEKPDIIYLLAKPTAQGVFAYKKFNIQNICFNVENEDTIVNMIREQRIVNLPTQVFRSQSSNFPFGGFTEQSGSMQIIDQRLVIPAPYEALTQTINVLMFECFVDQDVVSAPSDLYQSLTFENLNCYDTGGGFYGKDNVNVFSSFTLFDGTKATKTLYPNKYMLVWKLATDDSFMRGYNSSKYGSRTNIQVILHGNLTKGVLDSTDTNKDQNQNDLKQFISMRSYHDPTKASITTMPHYICEAFVRISFDNNPDPQVLNVDVTGELAGNAVNAG